jgi:uncharacterized protein YeaO (DUF488 family)
MLQTKSVQSPIAKSDGLRLLVARFRGRRLPASRYDVWMPSLGPSERLLRQILDGVITWAAFSKAYREELFLDGPIDGLSETVKNHGQKFTLRLVRRLAEAQPVTLLCHCDEDQAQCHRHVLKALIESSRV